MKFQNGKVFYACQMGKQIKALLNPKSISYPLEPLELLHKAYGLGAKRYAVVIKDDFSRFSWMSSLLLKMRH